MDIDDECPMEELTRKINHPLRVHPDLWHNEGGEMNDGPLCGCSVRSRRSGIRHGIYPGEIRDTACRPISNNVDKLYHYRCVGLLFFSFRYSQFLCLNFFG